MVEVARSEHDKTRPRSAMSDELLADYFAETEKRALQNPWYKAELRIARVLVNLCGKFEADIESSCPQFLPSMSGHGLPKISFDLTKLELGLIVKKWMAGPFYQEKEEEDECPKVRAKVKGEDGNIRRMLYERDEREYEEKKGIVRVKCHADFSSWGIISGFNGANQSSNAEISRANNAQIVSTVLNQISQIAHRYGLRLVFAEISAVHTDASMRSVFNGEG